MKKNYKIGLCLGIVVIFVFLTIVAILYLKNKNAKNFSLNSELYENYVPPGSEDPDFSGSEMYKPNPEEISYIPILMYHYIQAPPGDGVVDGLSVSPEKFEEQLNDLYDAGYRFENLDYVYKKTKNESVEDDKKIILTFDDGYIDFYTSAFPIIKRNNIKATVFIIVNRVGQPGYMNWGHLKELDKTGLVTIGSHTLNHIALASASEEKIKEEVLKSKEILESELGHKVEYFCYPYGSYNLTVARQVESVGYIAAVSTVQGTSQTFFDRFWWQRIRVGSGYTGASIISKIESYINQIEKQK